MSSTVSVALTYLDIKEFVIRAGYGAEVDWQAEVDFERITESDFLREAAWVVLAAGFREAVVRNCFEGVSRAFLAWCDARRIDARRKQCKEEAMAVFRNRRKIEAISEIVSRVAEEGIGGIKEGIRSRGVEYLQQFPYMGPVTAYHLGKNLGLGVVKPDRHLVRMAGMAGYGSPLEMCARVAGTVGDSVAVVDLVLWRYATLSKDYDMFQAVARSDAMGGGSEATARLEEDAREGCGERGP